MDLNKNKETKKSLISIVVVFFLLLGLVGFKYVLLILAVIFLMIFLLFFPILINKKQKFLEFFKSKFNLNINKNKNMDTINVNQHFSRGKTKKTFSWVVIGILIIWLFSSSIVIIEAGQTGVYSLFGKVRDKELSSGFHLVNPLARVTVLSIRTEEYTMSVLTDEGKKKNDDSIKTLTKEGLEVGLDITALYHLDEEKASDVYRDLGNDYEAKIIRPAIRSTIREVIAQYESKDIYSDKREQAAKDIFNKLEAALSKRGVVIEDVLLRNVELPVNLATSIQEKLQAEQEAQKYDFLLQKEEKEKARKIIEAEGQKEAQSIISSSLTPNYLYYLYIKELENREGTIYVPTDPDSGLPMFKGLTN
ncbi:prohibitin family protein [bacterium]|nr:prohibitin family protein [bacterium]